MNHSINSNTSNPSNTKLSKQQFQQLLRSLEFVKSCWSRHLPIVDSSGEIVGIVKLPTVNQPLFPFLRQAIYPSSGLSLPSFIAKNTDINFHQGEVSSERSTGLYTSEPSPLIASKPIIKHQSSEFSNNNAFEEKIAQTVAKCRYFQQQLQQKKQEVQTFNQQVEWLTASNHCLLEISQALQTGQSPEGIFNLIVTQVKTLFKSDRACIYRYRQSDMGGFVLAEAFNPEFLSTLGYIIRDEIVSNHSWITRYRQGDICNIEDLSTGVDGTPQTDKPLLAAGDRSGQLWQFFQVKAKLAVPIFHNQTLWGLLAIHQCTKPRQWTSAEIDVLKVLAIYIGNTIEQFELHQTIQNLQISIESQRQEHSTRLAQTLDSEATLQRITDRVRNSLDEEQILQTALQELANTMEVHYGQSILCDPSRVENCSLGECSILRKYTLPATRQLDNEASLDDISDMCAHLHWGESTQFCAVTPFLRRGNEAILVCPVFDGQDRLGSLQLFRRRHQSFSEAEVQLVQQVTSHCAIAIRQARLYQASQMQVQELEHLNQLKDDFLSTVSHELRTPLSSIKMVTNLLKLAMEQALFSVEPRPLSDVQKQKVAQYLKVLQDECEREISLINDLLATQSLNTGNHPFLPTSITLHEWIPQITGIFQHRTHMNQQLLELSIPEDLPPIVSDSFMLNRVLVELLNNACKYTPPGGHISLRATATVATIQLIVENTGSYIEPDQLHRIFEPFYRIPNSDRWKRGGTGLGLSLAKKFVEYLGGTIQADNIPDSVQFRVTLPQTPPDA